MRAGRRTWAGILVVLAALAGATTAHADEVVLRSGKRLRGHVTRTPPVVRVNPYGSRAETMTWGVLELPVGDVTEIRARRDRVWAAEAILRLEDAGVNEKAALLTLLVEARLRAESRRVAAEILGAQVDHAPAARVLAGRRDTPSWTERVRVDPASRDALRQVIRLETGLARRDAATTLPSDLALSGRPEVVERMAASERRPRGVHHGLVLPGDLSVSLYVPEAYDASRAYPLIVALHGGAARGTSLTGSPRDAFDLFVAGARKEQWILVCPAALEAPWDTKTNREALEQILDVVVRAYHVDLERIAIVGQGSGADGALAWAARSPDRFAAVGLAGLSSTRALDTLAGRGVGIWLHHGALDSVVPVETARRAASSLLKRRSEFVYCELPAAEHGLPAVAEADLVAFLRGHRRPRAPSAWPTSSFELPPTAAEKSTLGDPAAAWGLTLEADAGRARLLEALRRGRGEAEWAARRLADPAIDIPQALGLAILKDPAVPAEGRRWAAWLAAVRRWEAAVPWLGDILRQGGDDALLRSAAQAVDRLGAMDVMGDLLQALRDVSERYRASGTGSSPRDAVRASLLVVDLLAPLQSAGDGEVAQEIEELIVLPFLRAGRPRRGAPPLPLEVVKARRDVARAVGRAYAGLGAEATLIDLVEVALRAEPATLVAFREGLAAARRGER